MPEDVDLTKKVEVGRAKLEANILSEASKQMPQYGIELIDVRITGTDAS